MRITPAPALAFTALLTLPLLWSCEANETTAAGTPEAAPTDAPKARPAALASGLYASELMTNLLPVSVDLDDGLRSEGSGEITVRQLVRVGSQGSRELSVSGCRAAPESAQIDASLHALEHIAPEASCDEVEVLEEDASGLSLRRECDGGGFAQLRLRKLPQAEVASVVQLRLTAGDEHYDAAECFEMFSFDGVHHLYRDGQLLESQAAHIHHVTVGVTTNAGDLMAEWVIDGPLRAGRYHWNDTPAAGEPTFHLQVTGDHPWTAAEFTAGALDVEQLSPALKLSFTVEQGNAAPLEGQLLAPAGLELTF